MAMMSNECIDDAVGRDDSDVAAVADVDGVVHGDGQALGIVKTGVDGLAAVSACVSGSGQAALASADHNLV